MMAAITAAERGAAVTLLESNERLGKKLNITGKGRCNVTSDCEPPEFLKSICTNPRFLKSALYAFPPSAVMAFFSDAGVPLKTERGQRVFPRSDSAHDVADALEREAKAAGVRFVHQRVQEILTADGAVTGVRTEDGEYPCSAALLCTGGLSYPGTGSTGDGYAMAERLGHAVVAPRPSLVPWEGEEDCRRLQGLSLRNVGAAVYDGDRLLFHEQGELLFTHFGVSGPLMLTASTFMRQGRGNYRLEIDLKPGLSAEKLDERLLRDFSENVNRDFINALNALLPQKLIPVMVDRSGIPPHTKVNAVTRTQRLAFRDLLKRFPVALTRPRPIAEAIVTAGGVDVSQIQPRTMESKLIRGLYFAGEILDIDGRTGGFNLQIAWSTGYLAGRSVPVGG